MATSKLLKPTNVTISIPEFTDQPDQRVNSNGLDKEADAINALSEHIIAKTFNSCEAAYNNGVTGISFVRIPEGASDSPTQTGTWSILQNNNDSNYGWQLAMQSNSNNVYFRTKFKGSWRTWDLLTDQTTQHTLSSLKVTPDSTNSYQIYKNGKVVCLVLYGKINNNVSAWQSLGSIPSELRPSYNIIKRFDRGTDAYFQVTPSGDILTSTALSNNTEVALSVTWVI